MAKLTPHDPAHLAVRGLFRVAGPLVFLVGVGFLVTGMVSFFASMNSFDAGPPRYFWCGFVGMPLVFVGGVLTKLGYFGAVARYLANEAAPVGADTFNYVADETRPGVTTVASAVADGIRANSAPSKACTKCHAANDTDARFCKSCGVALNPAATS